MLLKYSYVVFDKLENASTKLKNSQSFSNVVSKTQVMTQWNLPDINFAMSSHSRLITDVQRIFIQRGYRNSLPILIEGRRTTVATE